MPQKLSKAAMAALNAVTNKRPKAVVDHLMKNGTVTTGQLRELYGYDHPPRAARDLKEHGIPLEKRMVKDVAGKRMAQYSFGDLDNIAAERAGGRVPFPTKFKKDLVATHGEKCGFCSAELKARYLRIDHRVPYSVAGKGAAASLNVKDYILVCGPCNSIKMQCCKECPNGLVGKDTKVCATCYWANPLKYSHVATLDIRRLDLIWTGAEVPDFDAAKTKAGAADGALPKFVKDAVQRAVRGR